MLKRLGFGGALTVSVLFAFVFSVSAFADGGGTASSTFSIDVSNVVLQLSVPENASIVLNPTSSAGDFDSTTITAAVSTNNMYGYSLTMTPTNGEGTTDLIGDASSMPTLADLDGGYTQSSFIANKWGYRLLSTDNYNGVPATLAPESWTSDGPTNETGHNITLAAKVDGSFPAGSYATTLNFQVVAKTPPRGLPDNCARDSETGNCLIQSVTGEVCSAIELYDTQFQVTDSRDHKNYWIAKLQDDNCWMTQNLDLDLDSSVALTSEKTDLGWNGSSYDNSSWQPSKTTYNYEDGTGDALVGAFDAYSFDPGDIYEQGTYFSEPDCGNYYTDTPCDSFSTTPDPVNESHGHVGNYYYWPAAVAMNSEATSVTNEKAQNSICPRNWRLPIADGVASEFASLNALYNSSSATIDQGLFESPVYFVRGGYANVPGVPSGASSLSIYQSSVSSASYYAYHYFFAPGSLNVATTSFPKSLGLSVRCLARQSDYLTVSFDANGGTGSMDNQRISGSAKLEKNTFTNGNYYFAGWNTKSDGTGEGFGDEALYTVESEKKQTSIKLYAQWSTAGRTCVNNCDSGDPEYETSISIQRAYELAYTEHRLGMYEEQHEGQGDYARVDSWGTPKEEYKGYDVRFSMQDIGLTYRNVKVCDLVTVIGDTYQALDTRDNKLYYIGKLKDGNCWMTQNLDLDLNSSRTYTNLDTDLGWNGTTYSSASWQPLRSTIDVPNYDGGTITGYSEDMNAPVSVNTGSLYWTDKFYKSTFNNYYHDLKQNYFSTTPYARNGKHGHIGNYYNWPAARATNDLSSDNSNGTVNSICPVNWRMPSMDPNNEFEILANQYNAYITSGTERDAVLVSSPLYFVRSGRLHTSAEINYFGSTANYWSETLTYNSYNNPGASYLRFSSSDVQINNLSGDWEWASGFSIRCVAR